MRRPFALSRTELDDSFDLTPIIDVVFLLIIFFILVCQFIAAENYEVEVPDAIASAQATDASAEALATVTVLEGEDGEVTLAVGAEKIALDGPDVIPLLTEAIDHRLAKADGGRVCLRCEKRVPFRYTKLVLEGISKSRAEDVQWAVVKAE